MKHEDLLDSWKEISVYLERDIRTCMRWEQDLGLPVHRVDESSSRAKVFAYKSEIDNWLQQRTKRKKSKTITFLDNKKNAVAVLAASILLSLCLAVLYIHKITSPSDSRISLVVLPFENQSSPEYNPYLTTGIMNNIISKIMNTGKFEIIPLTSKSKPGENSLDNKTIYKKTGADYILKGGARKEKNNIYIDVEIIRTKNGKNVFKGEFTEKMSKLPSMQLEILQKICAGFNMTFDDNRLQGSANFPDFDIYSQKNHILKAFNDESDNPLKLCLQGQNCLEYLTIEGNDQATQLFKEALDIDSSCAQAYLGLAQCYANFVNYAGYKNLTWLDKAEELVKTGQSLEPDLPEYFSTLIQIYLLQEIERYENKKELIRELAQKGLKKYPRYTQLISIVGDYYFTLYGETGDPADFARALEMKDKAFLTDPFAPRNIAYTELLMLAQNYSKAFEIYDLIKRDDDSINTPLRLMQIYYYMGDFTASKKIYNQINKDSPTLKLDHQFFLGMIAAQEGNREKALKIIKKINILGQDGVMEGFNLKMASIYLGLDMKEKGFQYLDTFFQKPFVPRRHHIYLRYIDIDRNFLRYKQEIFNKYKNRIAK